MRINYDVAELRTFVEVARRGSFVQAAQALSLSPSGTSRRITQLEQALGTRLLDRTTRSVCLTQAGQSLYARCGALLASLDTAVIDTVQQGMGLSGKVVLGCISTSALAIVPGAVQAFRQDYPDVRVEIMDDTGMHVLERVLAREVEFGLNIVMEPNPDILVGGLVTDPYVLVVPQAHALADRPALTWAELACADWRDCRLLGLRNSSAKRMQIDDLLQREGLVLPWFDEVENLLAMLGLLRQGRSMAIMPRLALPICHEWGLRAVPLTQPGIDRRVGLIRRRDVVLSRPAAALWNALAQALQSSAG